MSYFADREKGIEDLEADLLELADALKDRLKVGLRLDPNLVVQAYDSALLSATFHNIPFESLSYKKQLAHLGFWVAELKPVIIKPPKSPKFFIDKAGLAINEVIRGQRAALTIADKKFRGAESIFKEHATYPVSEYIAMQFIHQMMDSEFRRQIKDLPAHVQSASVAQNEMFNKVLEKDNVFADIVNGLRFHIFTPRAFVTLIESVFAFEGCPESESKGVAAKP